MTQALAIKYRPKTWEDVVEQDAIKVILSQQIKTKEFKHAYLFCGGAGTGKTTCARIFANEINGGHGVPIEMDAASQNGVDDVREIIQQARTQPLDSEYKVFILDEVHSFSNSAWQAMLKLIEEPPAKLVFIFCTTDPQKIPKTILSRVQRYDFQRISHDGIIDRLHYILQEEGFGLHAIVTDEALQYIAKIADGGMRDAITLLDKCLSYSSELTVENVVNALGTIDYEVMFNLTFSILDGDIQKVIEIIEAAHSDGKDLKQFIKMYLQFILDVNKYLIGCKWKYINIPNTSETVRLMTKFNDNYVLLDLLDMLVKLNVDIKYSSTARYDIESALVVFIYERNK